MTDTRPLLDPALYPFIDAMPPMDLNDGSVEFIRQAQAAQVTLGDPAAAGVRRTEVSIPQADHALTALLYEPLKVEGPKPGYLHIHGGGYVLGSPEGSDAFNLQICARLGVVIVAVRYRLAPEHPIPAPLEDCYAGLKWLHEQANALGVDPARIAIGGESAGGGLAAATAILARDRGEYAICHQHLTYPMLDCRTGRDGHEGDPLVGEFIWTRERNRYGWGAYLGDAAEAAPQVPALLDDFTGLPPAWIHTVSLDLFRDENIRYAQQLLGAGVAVELVVLPGACHGYQMLPGTWLAERFQNDHLSALGRALAPE